MATTVHQSDEHFDYINPTDAIHGQKALHLIGWPDNEQKL